MAWFCGMWAKMWPEAKSGEKFNMSRILGYLEGNQCIKIKLIKYFANKYLKALSECVSTLKKMK